MAAYMSSMSCVLGCHWLSGNGGKSSCRGCCESGNSSKSRVVQRLPLSPVEELRRQHGNCAFSSCPASTFLEEEWRRRHGNCVSRAKIRG